MLKLCEYHTFFPCVLWAFQYIFGYNSCARAYKFFPHGRSLDNDTFYHLVPNLNLSEAIYTCAQTVGYLLSVFSKVIWRKPAQKEKGINLQRLFKKPLDGKFLPPQLSSHHF